MNKLGKLGRLTISFVIIPEENNIPLLSSFIYIIFYKQLITKCDRNYLHIYFFHSFLRNIHNDLINLWVTICKTVCPMLSDVVCLSCLSVYNVGVVWANGWIDQYETWHAGRPWHWPHYVRWGPSSPSPKRGRALALNFRPMSIVAKRRDRSRCHLVWRYASALETLC